MSYKDRTVEPFVYQPCKIMPGQMAVPLTDFDNSKELVKWYQADGDRTLLVNYPLNQNSVVFDVGGYLGDWAAKIIDRYDCFVYIFEPVDEFYRACILRFANNPKVRVFSFGLGATNQIIELDRNGDESSSHRLGHEKEKIEIRDVLSFVLNENRIRKIDLMSLNCEGGEFALLPRILETSLIGGCDNIQVQFHADYPNAIHFRDKIRWWLGNTHDESYNFPFVWESWKIRKGE